MPNETKVLRDFIYMDVERLNSLYSQTFGGLVSQLIKSQSHTGTNTEGELSTSGEKPREVIAKRLVSESRHEAKNVVFNDYLYTQFEEGVASAILRPKGLTPDNDVVA